MSLPALPEWTPILIIPAIFFGFLALQFIIALRETRLVSPYILLDDEQAPPLPLYVAENGKVLAVWDFVYGGTLSHAKPSMKIIATVWMAADREIVVLTGAGTVARIPTAQTWLYTPLRNGRLLVTTDRNDEGDPSGLALCKHRMKADLPTLLDYHRTRLAEAGENVDFFPEDTPLEALHGLHARRTAALLDQGLAHWIDFEQRAWRYTWKGALRVCLGTCRQLFESLTQFWKYV
jgi:hypothetical protein